MPELSDDVPSAAPPELTPDLAATTAPPVPVDPPPAVTAATPPIPVAAIATSPVRTLELALTPTHVAALGRAPAFNAGRIDRSRSTALAITWHDSAEGVLRNQGLAVAAERGQWRLERLVPGEVLWPPATPAPLLAEAPTLDGLPIALPPLLPIASFEGRLRRQNVIEGDVELALELASGELRAFAGTAPRGWLRLSGPAEAVTARARALAAVVPLSVPNAGTAAAAIALARGEEPAPRRLGAPNVAPGATLGEAFAGIVAHLIDVTLHWAGPIEAARAPSDETTNAVHQMRVAVRRLRSALSVFSPAIAHPALATARVQLRTLATALGPARDWDVFTAETAADIVAAMPDEPRVGALHAAAARRRAAAHATLRAWLAGPDWQTIARDLAMLAALRPWQGPAESCAHLHEPAVAFASRSLSRRTRRMLQSGADLRALSDEALHELRKQGKKLRYTAEFFATCFPAKPTRRFLERLADLQEELGRANDAATAHALLTDLGPGHAFAAGAVAGYIAGTSGRGRKRITQAWKDFAQAERFWD